MTTQMQERATYPWPESLAKLTVEYIKVELKDMLPSSAENRLAQQDSLVHFDRNEIIVGEQLGKGGFSEVYEIKAFVPKTTSDKSWTASQKVIRSFYEENAVTESTGEGRYVIKHLKPTLMAKPKAFQSAAVDLAVEAQFLSSFRHPNILKIRGMARGGVASFSSGRHDGFFLIFDRLEETLEQRIETWRSKQWNAPPSVMVERLQLEKDEQEYHQDYTERIKYARQLASALAYLHERRVIFRDLKPSNIGLDAHGNIKLFDFGFARELPSITNKANITFEMSGRIGTLRYMAPEVALKKPYNLKADVYSWSIILWEMMSLEKPFQTLSREKFLSLVCKLGKRHKVDPAWPRTIRDLIHCSWADHTSTRPTMQEAYLALELMQEDDVFRNTDENTKAVETKRQRSSVVLEFPEAFEIEKREPVGSAISTATSATRESSTLSQNLFIT